MTDDLNVHTKKKWERIEVLGLLDTRKNVENFILEKSIDGHTKPKRYEEKLDAAVLTCFSFKSNYSRGFLDLR